MNVPVFNFRGQQIGQFRFCIDEMVNNLPPKIIENGARFFILKNDARLTYIEINRPVYKPTLYE